MPDCPPLHLSDREKIRYERQTDLSEIGTEGQLKLKNSSILIIGVGGLGSSAGLYLAAAGVGHIGIMDRDQIEPSNLQRQILYDSQQIGERKVTAAAARIQSLNPHINVEPYDLDFHQNTAREIAGRYDLLLDCTDNLITRCEINEFCVRSEKPEVFGAVEGFEGQTSVFDALTGPCYSCVFPITQKEYAPNINAPDGVISPLPGVIGSIMAMETIKYLLKLGQNLTGRLLIYDGLEGTFQNVIINKRPDCPVCGRSGKMRT